MPSLLEILLGKCDLCAKENTTRQVCYSCGKRLCDLCLEDHLSLLFAEGCYNATTH